MGNHKDFSSSVPETGKKINKYIYVCSVTSVVSDSSRPPWTVAHQAPLSMRILQARILEFGSPCPPPVDLPNPGTEPLSPASPAQQVDSLPLESPAKSRVCACILYCGASQVAVVVKNLPANAGDIRDVGSIPGSARSPGGGHGNPL